MKNGKLHPIGIPFYLHGSLASVIFSGLHERIKHTGDM
jgi:hypothetical protein